MNLELEKTIRQTLEKVHAEHQSDKTLVVLYDAIERCSNESFTYHRDLVFDMFFDNESLIEVKDSGIFYAHTDVRFKYAENETISKKVEDMIQDALDNNDVTIEYAIDWIEKEYKSYVFFFLELCLIMLDSSNHGIGDYVGE